MEDEDKPTELTVEDIDKMMELFESGLYDIKMHPCNKCGKQHIPSYGSCFNECDQCYFDRFPKEQVEAFFRSFFE